jgi:hypothetical protein
MSKHGRNFKKGSDDLDKPHDALDDNNITKSFYYAGKGEGPVAEATRDSVGSL